MYTPTDPSGNNALQGVDNAAIALGGGMVDAGGTGMAVGGTAMVAGTFVTVSTDGAVAIGGVPVAAAGATLIQAGATVAVGGTVLMANGKQNQEAGYNRGRSSNHLQPSSEATGDHSSFRRGSDGKISNTSTYKVNDKNPSGFDEIKRVDVKGGSHKNKNGVEVPTPHVHEQKHVRPARPDELPK